MPDTAFSENNHQRQQAVVLSVPNPNGDDYFEHFWGPTLGDVLEQHGDTIAQRNEAGSNVFYTTGTFANVVAPLEKYKGRKQDNCVAQRSLFLDIDAKIQLIPTVQACYKALGKFVEDAGLYAPTTLIDTGGGLHVYWICDEDIPLEAWQLMADTLAGAAVHFGLKCDTQCTVDRCRILRLPGYVNNKYTEKPEVSVSFDEPEFFSLEEIVGMLEPHIELRHSRPSRSASAARQNPASMFTGIDLSGAMDATLKDEGAAFAAGATPSWSKLRDASARGDGCKVIQWAMNNQDKTKYGLWTGILSIARCTDDEDSAIVDTCSEHPDYDLHTCKAKASSFDGPRTCAVLEYDAKDSGCTGGCTGCPMKGKITSPLIMGYPDFKLSGDTEQVTVPVTEVQVQPDGTEQQVVRLEVVNKRAWPLPYCRVPGKRGVFIKTKTTDANGAETWEVSGPPFMVEDIEAKHIYNDPGIGMTAEFVVTSAQGERILSMTAADISQPGQPAFINALTKAHINTTDAVNPTWKQAVSRFLNTLANDMAQNTQLDDIREQYGPVGDNFDEFVYGNHVYKNDGTVRSAFLSPGLRAIKTSFAPPALDTAQAYEQQTKLAQWRDLATTTFGMPEAVQDRWVLASGFACAMAPFVVPRDDRGGMIAINSSAAGSGKSSMAYRITEIYAGANSGLVTTTATLMGFLETLYPRANALPVVWDDIIKGDATSGPSASRSADSNLTLFHKLVMSSANGTARARHGDTEDTLKLQGKSWFYATLNRDPHSLVSHDQGAIARILSVHVPSNRFTKYPMARANKSKLDAWLRTDGPVVGAAWIASAITRVPVMQARYAELDVALAAKRPDLYADDSLRFARAIVLCSIVAAEEANRAGVFPFSVQEVETYGIDLLAKAIEHKADHVVSDEDLLATLINKNLGKAVFTQEGIGGIMHGSRTPNEVVMRVVLPAMSSPTKDTWVHVDASTVKAFASQFGRSVADIKRIIEASGGIARTQKSASGNPVAHRVALMDGLSRISVVSIKISADDGEKLLSVAQTLDYAAPVQQAFVGAVSASAVQTTPAKAKAAATKPAPAPVASHEPQPAPAAPAAPFVATPPAAKPAPVGGRAKAMAAFGSLQR